MINKFLLAQERSLFLKTLTKKTYNMKDQDLREKFEDVEKMTFHNHLTVKTSTNQCVKIAKDYAEKEVRNAKLPYQLFIGKVADILGKEKTSELLKESIEAFKTRENER